jgi:hypothetical protein
VLEIYADGVTNSSLGIPLTKLTFHSVVDVTPEGNEVRKVTHRLTIPTNSLLEICRNILFHAKQNQEGLSGAYDHLKVFSDLMLKDITVGPAPTVPKFEPKK